MPKISIIVPVFNSAPFLLRCLNSLAGQSLEDIETIIVVDEGSKDDSSQIVESFVANHEGIFRSIRTPHSGPGEARNRGFSLATSDYIAFVDSDDYVDRRYCESPLLMAERTGADIVCFSARMVNEYRGTERIIDPGVAPGMGPRKAIMSATVMVWDKLYRRSFLDRCRLHYPPFFHEDLAETPRLFAFEPKIEVLRETLYYYVKRLDSASGISMNVLDMDILRVARMLLDYTLQYPRFSAEFEYLAIRQLEGFCGACAGRTEDWAQKGAVEAQALLDSLQVARHDNPYFLLDDAKSFNAKKIIITILATLRKLIVGRLRIYPKLFLAIERLKFGKKKPA